MVVVTWQGRGLVGRCLDALAAQTRPHRVLVVDNASTDGSVEAARAVAGVTVIALERNAGFAAANNAGIKASDGELILLLNSDTLVPPGAIDALAGRLREVAEAAVAGPRLVDGEGRPELSFGEMISPMVEWRRKRLQQRFARGDAAATQWVNEATNREQLVDWVSGACLLVWRRDAEAAGLLDERFFLYTEDVDFCDAIRRRGRKVLFTPVATVTHLRGRSRASQPQASRRAYRRSHVAFYAKHHPAWAPVLRLYLRVKGE